MKILLLSTFDQKGGAAVACKRLATALQKNGAEVTMLVLDKTSSDSFVTAIIDSPLRKAMAKMIFITERIQLYLINRFNRENLFTISTASTGFNPIEHPLVKEADILHLHWINQGMLSLDSIHKLLKTEKPLVWTMHDLWPVTGICHYAGLCSNYMEECHHCKFLTKPHSKDLSYRVFQKKKSIFCGSGIHFVACSHWLLEKANTSMLRAGNSFINIPNPIDTNRFIPGNQEMARKRLNLPIHKRIILFGADIVSDRRKGMNYLIQATHLLADLKDRAVFVFCGKVKDRLTESFGLETHSLGYLSETDDLVNMYQAADCFVIPSLEENLPNMIMEAMACGVPCVGFHTGGIPEMISHRKNGYVATLQSAADLATGIRFVLEKSDDHAFRQAARDFVVAHYTERVVAKKYLEEYKNALNEKHS